MVQNYIIEEDLKDLQETRKLNATQRVTDKLLMQTIQMNKHFKKAVNCKIP